MRCWGLAAVCVASALLWTSFASAQTRPDDTNIYRVTNVEARAQAESTTAAQAQALTLGHLIAFEQLLRRLTAPEDQWVAESIDPTVIAGLVTGLEFPSQDASPTSWVGRINITFDRRGVTDYLSSRGVTPIETVSRPGVVLPLLSTDGTNYVLWDESNIWLTAWLERSFADEQIPMVSPRVDGRDLGAITAFEAQQLDRGALGVFASNYLVERVFVARAFINPNTGLISGRLDEIDFASTEGPVTRARASGQTMDEVRDQLAAAVLNEWKSLMKVTDPRESSVDVTVYYDTITEWLLLQDVFADTALLSAPLVTALTGDGAIMRWRYRGRPVQLQRALQERGVALSARSDDGGWEAQTSARAARSAPGYSPYGGGAYTGDNDTPSPSDYPQSEPASQSGTYRP